MIIFPEPVRASGQSDVLELACKPIEIVRIAFIGLGKRGKMETPILHTVLVHFVN